MINRLSIIVWGAILALMVTPSVPGYSFDVFHSEGQLLIAGDFGRATPPAPRNPMESSRAPSSNSAPSWFWDPPATTVAVGYSPQYQDAPTANDSAFTDAAWRLFKDRRANVNGGMATSYTPYGQYSEGSSIDYVLSFSDSMQFDGFLKSVVRVDSAIVPSFGAVKGMRVMLVATSEVEVDNSFIPSPSDVNAERGTNDAIGVAESYYYESSSWIEAERGARIQLAMNQSTTTGLTAIERSQSQGDRVEAKTVDITVDVVISNVRVVKRRLDPITNSRKVWVTGTVTANK